VKLRRALTEAEEDRAEKGLFHRPRARPRKREGNGKVERRELNKSTSAQRGREKKKGESAQDQRAGEKEKGCQSSSGKGGEKSGDLREKRVK